MACRLDPRNFSAPLAAPQRTRGGGALALLLITGIPGLYYTVNPWGPHSLFCSLLQIQAWVMLTMLMVPLHEAGHWLAARLCGLKVLACNLGSGPVRWEGRIADAQVLVRTWPGSGFISFCPDERRGRYFLCVLGGPLVNIVLCALCAWLTTQSGGWRSSGPYPLFQLLTLANAMQLAVALWPARVTMGGALLATDGLQMLRLLRGLPAVPESLPPRPPDNSRRRRTRAAIHWLTVALLIALIGMIGFGLFYLAGRWMQAREISASSSSLSSSGLSVIVAVWAIFMLGRMLRRGLKAGWEKVPDETPPRQRLHEEYQLVLTARAKPWPPPGLPVDLLGELQEGVRKGISGKLLPAVDRALEFAPGNLMLLVIRHDALVDDERRDEAAALLDTVLEDASLPEIMRHRLNSCRIADHTVTATGVAPALLEDYLNSERSAAEHADVLCDCCSTVLGSSSNDLLPLALQWSQQALDMLPDDPGLKAMRGAVLVESGQLTEGRALLKQVSADPAPGVCALATGFDALAAWRSGDAAAKNRVRHALRQQPPPWLKRRLEAAVC